jgi:hypothetical protein
MFNKDGSWKEFGTTQATHTVFPCWMACILWAIASYTITLLVFGGEPIAATAIVAAAMSEPQESPEDLIPPLPIKTKSRRKNIIEASLPGYHMLNKEATEEIGTPQYIYVGEKPLKKPGYYVMNPATKKYDYIGMEPPSDEE